MGYGLGGYATHTDTIRKNLSADGADTQHNEPSRFNAACPHYQNFGVGINPLSDRRVFVFRNTEIPRSVY